MASCYAAPLLIVNGRGLIVNTGHYGAVCYFRGPVYGAQKARADKMAADMAKELRPHNVAAVSIWMGGLDTERAGLSGELAARITSDSEAGIAAVHRQGHRGPVRFRREDAALRTCADRGGAGVFLGVTDVDGSHPLSDRYTMGGPPELHPSLMA